MTGSPAHPPDRARAERWRAEAPEGTFNWEEKKKVKITGVIGSVVAHENVQVYAKKKIDASEVFFRVGVFLFRLWREGRHFYLTTQGASMHLSSYSTQHNLLVLVVLPGAPHVAPPLPGAPNI